MPATTTCDLDDLGSLLLYRIFLEDMCVADHPLLHLEIFAARDMH